MGSASRSLITSALAEQREEHAKVIDELKAKTDAYINVIRDENATKLQRYEAYVALQKLYPQLLKNIELETFLLMEQAEVEKLINKGQERYAFIYCKSLSCHPISRYARVAGGRGWNAISERNNGVSFARQWAKRT